MWCDDFDLGMIFDDGFGSVVKHAGDGDVHGLLLGHNMAGVAMFNVPLKDAGAVGRAGSVQVGVLPWHSMRCAQAGRRSASGADGRSGAVLSNTNRRAQAGSARVSLDWQSVRRGKEMVVVMLVVVEAVHQLGRMHAGM